MHHKHHIVPLHEWKQKINPNATRYDKEFNSPENVVYLTIEQHAQVHQLLFELNGQWQDEFAWKFLSGQKDFTSLHGVSKSEQHKEKIRLASLKRWQSKEEREKQSQRFSGKNNPMYGKPGSMKGVIMSECSRQKMREAKIKLGPVKVYKWEIIHPNGIRETIINLKEYCRKHGLSQGNMVEVSKGSRPHHKGYKCKRIIDTSCQL